VAGVYAQRAIREARARSKAPLSVPATVEQESNEFSFSKVEQEHTLFTVRASHATQYKDQNRAVLQDVWITIYGKQGNRNDNIHTRECTYEPKSGNMVCQGDVQIDLSSATPQDGKPADKALQVTTRDLSFNRETGEASTVEPVQFSFADGRGSAVGMTYSSQNEIVKLNHDVQLNMTPSDKTGGLPVTATGGSLEIRRNDRKVELAGPAVVREGGRELSADNISIELDADFHARHAIAQGHPAIRSTETKGEFTASGNQFEAFLSPAGWIERIVADGKVEGTHGTAERKDHFSMAHAEFTMQPEHNLIKTMNATGAVVLDSHQGSDTRSIKTDALLVNFAPGQKPTQTLIQSAETAAPGIITTKSGNDSTELRAKKFVTQFNAEGHLEKLFGYSGVEIHRQMGSSAPQVSTSTELAATFGAGEDWSTLNETGNVHFQQSDRMATAAHAQMIRATDSITMNGSPVLSDSQSRTTAGTVMINQKSGEIQAAGGVISTYASAAQGGTMNIGSGPGHVSADTLNGSTSSGHVTYSGHARLWQGESVLEANQIEVWRDQKKMQATGNVIAVFPQASPAAKPFAKASPLPPNTPSASSSPTLWQIRAPLLTYWSDSGKARLEDGVTADSQQGSMQSSTLDVFLAAPASGPKAASATATGAGRAPNQPKAPSGVAAGPAEGRQLERALARGGVTVRQGDRKGTAEQAEYTASDGKFVLSGGQPTIIDASSDTTTGHSLTFFVANDTILIESQEGSRTLTKHRVEK
jgi:lipopolysaccharide export system protein LptA